MKMVESLRITAAVEIVEGYAMVDGAEHKQWVIDRVLVELLGPDHYVAWVKQYNDQAEREGNRFWSRGVAP